MASNGTRLLSRRQVLRYGATGAALATLAACQPKIIKETVVVEKPVEKVVKETVVVEGKEKVVEKTVVVEKQVVKEVAKSMPVVRWVYFMPTDGRDDLLRLLNDFQNEKAISVQFEPDVGGWDAISEKMLAEFAAGNAPDVWINYGPYVRKCIDKKIALSFNEFLDRDKLDLSDFIKGQLDAGTKDGKMYGMPNYCGIWGMWYNKDIFDAAGVPVPNKTWTHDDFLNAAQKLCKRDDKGVMTQAGVEPALSLEFGLSTTVWSYGGEVSDEDRIKCLLDQELPMAALQERADLKWKYKLVPSDAEATAMNTAGGWGTFPSGKAAMREDGAWFFCCNMDAIKDKFLYGWAPHWKGPGPKGRQVTFCTTDLWLANQRTKNPDAVWEFVKWVIGKDAATWRINWEHTQPALKSLFPVWEKSIQEFIVKKNPKMEGQLDMSPFKEGYDYARPMFWWQCHTEVMEQLNPVIDQIYKTGKGEVKNLIPEVTQKINGMKPCS